MSVLAGVAAVIPKQQADADGPTPRMHSFCDALASLTGLALMRALRALSRPTALHKQLVAQGATAILSVEAIDLGRSQRRNQRPPICLASRHRPANSTV